jgi:Domain of unknown function (DUF1707)
MVDPTPEPPQPLPAQRASDADRERTATLLREAAGDGRLTVEELGERLDAAYAARTTTELEPLLADVRDPADAAAGHAQPLPVRPGPGATRWIVSLLGGNDRKGRWRIAPRCTVVNVMGGSDLDLHDAELAAQRVELRVFSFMGGSDIRVPEGLDVEVSKFALMGGNDVDLGPQRPRTGGPAVRIRLLSIMGGSNVKRGRRRSRRERRHGHGHGHDG